MQISNRKRYEERSKLREDILKLKPTHWTSICTGILIPNNENITINKSGVHFCLMSISNESIDKIKRFIKHIYDTEKDTDYDNEMRKYFDSPDSA